MPHRSAPSQARDKKRGNKESTVDPRAYLSEPLPGVADFAGQKVLTLEEAREALSSQGKSIADFARENSLDEPTVYQVLSGKKKGLRGEAHRAAVLLGIKAGTLPPTVPSFHLAPSNPLR